MDNPLQSNHSVGVVIPAYNEADNISAVLAAVCAAGWLEEIIVVDDGSSDATSDVAQNFARRDERILIERFTSNHGKAAAMLAGVRALSTDLVIFLDADLVGLTPSHLRELQGLQKSGSREMAVALFQMGHAFPVNVPQRLVPHLSGQRCLWRGEAEQALLPLASDRYGVEAGLSIHARLQHWKVRKITWSGVTHHLAWRKRKMMAGLHSRWEMYSQIVNVIARNRPGIAGGTRIIRFVKKDRLTPR